MSRDKFRIMHLTTLPDPTHKPPTPTGVGAPEQIEIEITPAMTEAGVAALSLHLLNGEVVAALTPLLVADVYRAMEASKTASS